MNNHSGPKTDCTWRERAEAEKEVKRVRWGITMRENENKVTKTALEASRLEDAAREKEKDETVLRRNESDETSSQPFR